MVRIEFRTSGVKRLNAKTKKIALYARGKYSKDVVDIGYKYAKRVAPKHTRSLIRAIKKPKPGKQSAKLILIQPNHPDGRNRPYHLWMHGIKAPVKNKDGSTGAYDTSRGNYRPRSGKPKFMYAAQKQMERKATETFIKKVRKL